jgi:hypothetical protein
MKRSEAIEVIKKLRHWIDYGAGELEPTANTVIEAIDTVVAELEKSLPCERCKKLEYMIENGLGWKDMENDISPMHEL